MNEQEISRTKVDIVRFQDGALEESEDEVAVELPITIMLNRKEFATLVCTPTDVQDLIYGFLASEGIIRKAGQIRSMEVDLSCGYVYTEMENPPELASKWTGKRVVGSCCGKSRQFYLYTDMITAKTVTTKHIAAGRLCCQWMKQLQNVSEDFQYTGGVHNAAICSNQEMLAIRSDIGRHNALDKLYGYWLRRPFPLHDKMIIFSGRISSEVLLKTAKMGIGILISKSAPTDLAIRMAEELGITAVGFVRGDQFNVYSHPWRIEA